MQTSRFDALAAADRLPGRPVQGTHRVVRPSSLHAVESAHYRHKNRFEVARDFPATRHRSPPFQQRVYNPQRNAIARTMTSCDLFGYVSADTLTHESVFAASSSRHIHPRRSAA